MGISGLLPLLKPACKPVNISQFRGKTFAIDVYCFLHKGAFGCAEALVQGKQTDGYVKYVMKYVSLMIYHDIKPILVFDGRNLPSKLETEKKRRAARKEARERAVQLMKEGRGNEAKEYFQRCVDITPEMAQDVIRAARDRNVDCIVAPYEADAQLAYLATSGIADFVVTEDSDLTLFGCERVLFKLIDSGDCVLYEKEHLNKVFGLQADLLSFEKFRYMCITAGCDYLANLPGIGLGKAKNFWLKVTNPDLRNVLRKIPAYLKMPQVSVTQDYIEGFIRANNTFLYQLVFDPVTRKEKPLTPYPADLREEIETLTYAGAYSSPDIAAQMALGNMNIRSQKIVDNFDPDKTTINLNTSQVNPKYGKRSSHQSMWCRDFIEKSKSKWLEEVIVRHYREESPLGLSVPEFAKTLRTLLRNCREEAQAQTEMFDLCGFHRFDMIREILEKKDELVMLVPAESDSSRQKFKRPKLNEFDSDI